MHVSNQVQSINSLRLNLPIRNINILGNGDLSVRLTIKARSFSAAAKEKLVAAGCSLTVLPGRKKWMKPSVLKNLARADEYFAKKRASVAALQVASEVVTVSA